MRGLKIAEDLRPLSDMKAKPNEVVTHAEKSGRPVVLTRYGKGVAVLLSVEAFEELESAAARLRLISALREAEKAVDKGDVVDHDEMDELLAGWASPDRRSEPASRPRRSTGSSAAS